MNKEQLMKKEGHDHLKDVCDLMDMLPILLLDVGRCGEEMSQEKDPDIKASRTRDYVRAAFAAIEGLCEAFRGQAFMLELKRLAKTGQIDLGTLCALSGDTFAVVDGALKRREMRIKFLDSLLFSLNSFAKAHDVSYRTEKGHDWIRIKNAVEVRHRVTHPSDLKALTITQKNKDDVNVTLNWFIREMRNILKAKGVVDPSSTDEDSALFNF